MQLGMTCAIVKIRSQCSIIVCLHMTFVSQNGVCTPLISSYYIFTNKSGFPYLLMSTLPVTVLKYICKNTWADSYVHLFLHSPVSRSVAAQVPHPDVAGDWQHGPWCWKALPSSASLLKTTSDCDSKRQWSPLEHNTDEEGIRRKGQQAEELTKTWPSDWPTGEDLVSKLKRTRHVR